MMSNSNLVTIHGAEIRMILLWLLNSLRTSPANERNACQTWNYNLSHILVRNFKRYLKYFQTHDRPFLAKDAILRKNAIFEFNFDLYERLFRLHTNMPKSIDFIRNEDFANHQIIIIGAGMAGLGAALTLFQNGYKDIKMLEAEAEPGGRLKTIQLENGFIELGAQWIHGKENCLYKLAEDHNLLSDVTSIEGSGIYIRDDGYIFNNNLVNEVRLEIEKVMTECEKFVDELKYPSSFGEFLEERFQLYLDSTKDSKDVLIMKEELFDWHIRFLLVDNSCSSLNDISAREWGRYVEGTENVNLKNGYRSLVNILLQMLPNQILSCECPVSKIIWSDTLNNIQVYCVNGRIFRCDHVIMTASLGYLKSIDNMFEPPLPYKLQKSIESMGFYGIAKIFLIFKYKWWNVNGFQMIWRKSTKLNRMRNWTRWITGFDVVYNQSNILLGWVSGEGVSEMEKLSESEIGKDCVTLLQTFLNRPIPFPMRIIRSNWMSSSWFRGSYSHISPQCDQQKTGPTTLSEPVAVQGVPKILLAGEACSPSHFSTTHGAFESGQAQAQFLINYLK